MGHEFSFCQTCEERLGISRSTPLSDEERMDFEERVIPWLKEHSHEKGTK